MKIERELVNGIFQSIEQLRDLLREANKLYEMRGGNILWKEDHEMKYRPTDELHCLNEIQDWLNTYSNFRWDEAERTSFTDEYASYLEIMAKIAQNPE